MRFRLRQAALLESQFLEGMPLRLGYLPEALCQFLSRACNVSPKAGHPDSVAGFGFGPGREKCEWKTKQAAKADQFAHAQNAGIGFIKARRRHSLMPQDFESNSSGGKDNRSKNRLVFGKRCGATAPDMGLCWSHGQVFCHQPGQHSRGRDHGRLSRAPRGVRPRPADRAPARVLCRLARRFFDF